MAQTTIRIDKNTRDQLEKLKVIPQEPMDQVIKRMLAYNGPVVDDEGVLNEATVKSIKQGLQDMLAGKTISTEEMRRRVQSRMERRRGKGDAEPARIQKSKGKSGAKSRQSVRKISTIVGRRAKT